ncbi:MAG: hypothetical protein ACOZQL_32065 [Myxococcota bacterium]
MTFTSPVSRGVRLLAVCLTAVFPLTAVAQSDDDAPIPYDDDSAQEEPLRPKKAKKKRRAEEIREEDEEEKEGEESKASLDDPNIGVGGELLSGLALLDSAKFGVDPRYYFGVRFTWEFGRLIPDEYLREMFFADVTWFYSWTKEGTTQVNVDTHLHDFTIAPAFNLPFGHGSWMSFYAQLGAGFDYSYSITKIDKNTVTLGGTKFLFQYGIGLRGRPAVVADGSIRIDFRVEVTRFVRGYMHDMYIGAGLGMVF